MDIMRKSHGNLMEISWKSHGNLAILPDGVSFGMSFWMKMLRIMLSYGYRVDIVRTSCGHHAEILRFCRMVSCW